MVPDEVERWLGEHGYGRVTAQNRAAGGCIHDSARLETTSGRTIFLKTNAHAPADLFECEASGLEALHVDGGPRVPRPFLYGPQFLLLEDLDPGAPRKDFWPELGRRLAALHGRTHAQFGFDHDNYIGSTPQPNPWTGDGWTFFAEHRLLFQARLARRQNLLPGEDFNRVERLTARLRELVPAQPASLIHGDLWSGNVLSDAQGRPAIIDPAASYSWAEAELAMTALFGGFPLAFYQAYEETRPLEAGYRERFGIYNLYHLLNHLNLFGTGYLGQVQAILRRFSG